MANSLLKSAKTQAHEFVELLWHELPENWTCDSAAEEHHFELWLLIAASQAIQFGYKEHKLLAMARRKAENFYQNNLRQKHHTHVEQFLFRFRIEMAILKVCNASIKDVIDCNAYSTILTSWAYSEQYSDRRLYYS